jgi:HPt (histidine-containing phosphotransfer) domain-containing protein
MTMASHRALDPAVLDTLRQLNAEGQPDVLAEVFGVFLADAPARLEAIASAVNSKDAAALQRAAHTLKGAAGTIGAVDLQNACRQLEQMGKQQSFDGAVVALDVLRREYRRVKDEIDQLL